MSQFVDQMLAQLSDPAQLVQVLSPTTDVTHSRLLTLLGAAYDMPEATIHDVRDLQVQHSEIERPVFLPKRTEGTLMETTAPEFRRTALSLQRSDLSGAIWIDLAAEVGLTLVLEIDPGEVDSIVTRELDNFTSLADFQSRFRFIDMNAFMAQLRVSTFEEFKSRYQFAMTEIRLKSVAAFDPNDATNQQRFTLDIAVLIRDSIDVAAALRDAKLARTALESTVQYKPVFEFGEVRTAYAPIVLFPASALPGVPFTADALTTLFAAEQILAIFVAPP